MRIQHPGIPVASKWTREHRKDCCRHLDDVVEARQVVEGRPHIQGRRPREVPAGPLLGVPHDEPTLQACALCRLRPSAFRMAQQPRQHRKHASTQAQDARKHRKHPSTATTGSTATTQAQEARKHSKHSNHATVQAQQRGRHRAATHIMRHQQS